MRELPDGLTPINTAAGVYRYTEVDSSDPEPAFMDFVVFRDGTVEITAHWDAPIVPAEVLRWIADLAEQGEQADAARG